MKIFKMMAAVTLVTFLYVSDANAQFTINNDSPNRSGVGHIVHSFSQTDGLQMYKTPSILIDTTDVVRIDFNTFDVSPLELTDGYYEICLKNVEPLENGSLSFCAIAWPVLKGDVTGDQVVDVNDLLLVMRNIRSKPSGPYTGADVDGDARMTFMDVFIVFNTYGNELPPYQFPPID